METKKITEILEEVKEECFSELPKEAQDSIMERFIYLLLTK